METVVKKCKACGSEEGELLRCTRCKAAYYCNQTCQRKDYPSHKLTCKKPTDEAKKTTNEENAGVLG